MGRQEVLTTSPLEARIRGQAAVLGFSRTGITRSGPAATWDAFVGWIARGFAGEMHYLPRGADKRRDTTYAVPGARSAIVVTMDYGGRAPTGPVARYARGDDYHDVMLARLRELHRWLEAEVGRAIPGKAYVDTGPLLERDLAQRAGIGWIGKNTMLIDPERGSFFFLGALLLDIELEPDAPFQADRCGTCTRCLDACPTGAIVEPRVLDATRCISYLTIEHRGAFDAAQRASIGEHLYGCDICQDVCPWNERFADELNEPAFAAREAIADKDAATLARDVLEMNVVDFPLAFRGSPMKRARRTGLRRNAAAVLSNCGAPSDAQVIASALESETDDGVRAELQAALATLTGLAIGQATAT